MFFLKNFFLKSKNKKCFLKYFIFFFCERSEITITLLFKHSIVNNEYGFSFDIIEK